MKLVSTIAALFLLPSVSAFAPANPTSRQSTAVCSTRDGYKDQFKNRERDQANYVTAQNTPKNQFAYVATASEACELSYDPSAFPKNLPLQQIQGGNSRLTWKMPQGADRLQMLIQTNGRPLKARVELWLGPIRRVHFVDIACMNGAETPFRACLKFKNSDSAGPQTLEISTSEDSAFPALVGVDVMTKDRSVERQEAFDRIWKASTKMYSQGDKTVRVVPIADHVKSVQLLVWSKDVGKKSFKANVELLQGPNTKRQYYELQCGGGTQPYHAIFETPGNGWTMRWTNTKTLHDGSHEFVVVPYELESDAPTDAIDVTPMYSGGYADKNNEFGYGETLGPHGSRSAPFTGNGQVGRL